MILRLIRTDKMSAKQAHKKGLTSVVLASAWEAYQIIGSEAAPPEIMHPRQVLPKLEVYGIRWPIYDDWDTEELHLIDPDKSANILVGAMKVGKPMRKTAESVWKGGFLTELAKAARTVADGADITPTKLLTSVLGDGHIQDETCFPLACAMAEEQLEAEREERRKPVVVVVGGKKWLANSYSGWLADGPQPTKHDQIYPDSRKQIAEVDFDTFVSSRVLGEQLQVEGDNGDRLSFVGGIGIDFRFAPLLEGRTAHASRIYDGEDKDAEKYTGVVLLDSDGNRVAIIAPYLR